MRSATAAGPRPRRRSTLAGVRRARSALLLSLIEARQLDVLTVPLGALADAYLDALAALEADRLGNVSGVRGRRRPAHPDQEPGDAAAATVRAGGRAGRRGPDPEAELRAGLILYRAFRDAGPRARAESRGPGRAVPPRAVGRARRRARPGARPPDGAPLDPRRAGPGARPARRPRAAAGSRRPRLLAPRRSPSTERAEVIRAALRGAAGDRAPGPARGRPRPGRRRVTFLAMLELMKRREIVVEQAEPWGPIVARRDDRRGAGGGRVGCRTPTTPLDESLESFA